MSKSEMQRWDVKSDRNSLGAVGILEFLERGGDLVSPRGDMRAFSIAKCPTQNRGQLEAYINARTAYVKTHGWETHLPSFGSEDYGDSADLDTQTICVIVSDVASQAFVAGMRLTPYPQPEDCLSFSMLHRAANMQRIARRSASWFEIERCIKSGGTLWDITRLVPGPTAKQRARAEDTKDAICRMIGTAMFATERRPNDIWLYLATANFRRLLVERGVQHEILCSGKVSTIDHSDSMLTATRPSEILQHRDLDSRTRQQILRGFEDIGGSSKIHGAAGA